MTEDEMLSGYLDGFYVDSPTPSANRSNSYRHGFGNGRADREGRKVAPAHVRRVEAEEAIKKDAEA